MAKKLWWICNLAEFSKFWKAGVPSSWRKTSASKQIHTFSLNNVNCMQGLRRWVGGGEALFSRVSKMAGSNVKRGRTFLLTLIEFRTVCQANTRSALSSLRHHTNKYQTVWNNLHCKTRSALSSLQHHTDKYQTVWSNPALKSEISIIRTPAPYQQIPNCLEQPAL